MQIIDRQDQRTTFSEMDEEVPQGPERALGAQLLRVGNEGGEPRRRRHGLGLP